MKLKTEKLVAILVAVVLLAVLGVGMYQSSLTTVPSKFTTARDNNGGISPMASYDLEAVKRGYDNFSLANAENLVKVKFISREDREYYVDNDGTRLFISEEESKDYLDKNRVYPAFDMTYEEVYGLKGLGNPVKKYMGMKEKDFEEQMRALKQQ